MGIYSSGSKWRRRAKGAEAEAVALQKEQQYEEFGRNLLANIRQERLARAELATTSQSDFATSSSAIGAMSNIDSSLAGEMGYSYQSSLRMQRISDLQQQANEYYKKYQKQQRTRSLAFQTTGIVAGAAAGGLLAPVGAGLGGAAAGAGIGQGVGQVATGDYATGVSNMLQGAFRYAGLRGNAPINIPVDNSRYLNASTGGVGSRSIVSNSNGIWIWKD